MAIEYLIRTIPELKENGSQPVYVRLNAFPMAIREGIDGNITCNLAAEGQIIPGELPECLDNLSDDGLYKIHGLWENGTFYLHKSDLLEELRLPERKTKCDIYSDYQGHYTRLKFLKQNREKLFDD